MIVQCANCDIWLHAACDFGTRVKLSLQGMNIVNCGFLEIIHLYWYLQLVDGVTELAWESILLLFSYFLVCGYICCCCFIVLCCIAG